MGREATVIAEVDKEKGEVHALLESSELILRGAIRRRFPRPTIEQVQIDGQVLQFRSTGEIVRLHLGSAKAVAWRVAILTPPPSLRKKLGLEKGARALLVGGAEDAALKEALDGMLVNDIGAAAMIVACILSRGDLEDALTIHASQPGLPIWAIHAKGQKVSFGEREIRLLLRAAGLRDTKSCAVSPQLTATRFNLPA